MTGLFVSFFAMMHLPIDQIQPKPLYREARQDIALIGQNYLVIGRWFTQSPTGIHPKHQPFEVKQKYSKYAVSS